MRAFLILLPLAACAPAQAPAPAAQPVGIDLGGAKTSATASAAPYPASTQAHGHDHGAHGSAPAPAGVPGHGVIDAVDPGRRRVTLSHDPMPEIGWPAMTMVFPIPAGADMKHIKPGHHVDFTLRKGASGSYDLIDIRPSDH